jgi:hypothetical protein
MSDEPTWWVKPSSGNAVEIGFKYGGRYDAFRISAESAAVLASTINEVIAEAKRQADPFEKWWSGLERTGDCAKVTHERWVSKEASRLIWDAATKGNR